MNQIKLAALFLALLVPLSTIARPNIVVVMVDDLDVAVYKTALDNGLLPNIKTEMIDRGTTFEQMFTSQPLCCPSRATFNTGQYPQNHGVVDNPNQYQKLYDEFKVKTEPVALATWLKQPHADGLTYRTGFFGKYLNGSGKEQFHNPAGWDVWQAMIPKTDIQCMYGFTLANSRGVPITYGTSDQPEADPRGYQTDKLADLAKAFIGAGIANKRPFFLVVTPTSPHVESCNGGQYRVRTAPRYTGLTPTFNMPAEALSSYNEADVSDKPLWLQRKEPTTLSVERLAELKTLFNDKVAALRPVDDMVKTIFDELRFQGKAENTVVIFTSDNGYQYGTHRMSSKFDMYEESIRIPMVVTAPGSTAPNVQQSWVMNNDWAATIADYAEVTPRMVVDGRSFRPLLGNQSTANTRNTVMMRAGYNPEVLARTSIQEVASSSARHRYQAIRTKSPDLTGDVTGNKVVVYHQAYNADGSQHSQEFYELDTDPNQAISRHTVLQFDQAEKLKAKLNAIKACSGVSCVALENN